MTCPDKRGGAAQLGHQSVATTGAIYAHVTPSGQARAADMGPQER